MFIPFINCNSYLIMIKYNWFSLCNFKGRYTVWNT